MFEIWILWGCLAGFVIFYGLLALKDTTNIFSPPLIISILVFGTLVVPHFYLDDITLDILLDVDYYIFTMMYAVLCLLTFCFFYEKGLHSKQRARRHQELVNKMPSGLISLYVTIVAAVGFSAQLFFAEQSGGLVAFYSQAHGAAARWNDNSAYFYTLPNLLWPALLMAYIVWKNGGHRSLYPLFLLILIGAALLANTFLFGNRGGVIRFSIILGGVYVFIHRPLFARTLPMIGLLVMVVAIILVLPNYRNNLHLGSDISVYEALEEYFERKQDLGDIQAVNLNAVGHELFLNVAVLQAASETGTYGYGAHYIYPFMNFVPRFLWPSKPYISEFGVAPFALIERVTGWAPGKGSAYSAIGHSFLAFSWFGCMAWGIVGFYCGRVFRAARDTPSLINLGFLIASLIAVVYWGTQNFTAFFYAWFYTIAPFYGLRVFAAMNRSMSLRPRAVNPAAIRHSQK